MKHKKKILLFIMIPIIILNNVCKGNDLILMTIETNKSKIKLNEEFEIKISMINNYDKNITIFKYFSHLHNLFFLDENNDNIILKDITYSKINYPSPFDKNLYIEIKPKDIFSKIFKIKLILKDNNYCLYFSERYQYLIDFRKTIFIKSKYFIMYKEKTVKLIEDELNINNLFSDDIFSENIIKIEIE